MSCYCLGANDRRHQARSLPPSLEDGLVPEHRYVGQDRIRDVRRRPNGRVVVTFRRGDDGVKRDPVEFASLEDYLLAVRREYVPGGSHQVDDWTR